MINQLLDGHLRGGFFGKPVQEFTQKIIRLYLSFFDQLHNQNFGKQLINGSNVKIRTHGIRSSMLPV